MTESSGINVEAEIVAYLTKVAASRGRSAIGIEQEASFFDSGILDSLSLLDFVTFLERRYDIEIPGKEILPENFGNLSAVTQYLNARLRRRESG